MEKEGRAEIHSGDPFATPIADRSPARRFRGRLVAPVTVWTSGTERNAGLTVSSVLIAEGEPSFVLGLINDTTDLWDEIQETRAFVVHVLGSRDRLLAERFAGLRPSPGGLFEGLHVEGSPFGPVLADQGTRAFCRFTEASQEGFHRLVRGQIEKMEFEAEGSPLVHHRGTYGALREPKDSEAT